MEAPQATYFNRLGKLAAVGVNLRSYQNTQLTALTNTTTGAVAQYNAESDLQSEIGSQYISMLNSPDSIGGQMASVAADTVNRAVYRDSGGAGGPRYNQTLQQNNTTASLEEIIRQMKAAGASIQVQAVTATVNAFTGTGNGQINVSTRRPVDGLVQENLYAETILLRCNNDSYTGTATAGNEGFRVTGQGIQTDSWAFNWPLGSNCSLSLRAIDGNTNNGSGNVLTNSGFNTWTGSGSSSTLNNWTLVAGAYGTNITKETGTVYDGAACIALTGDGTTNANITQTFDNSSFTLGELDPLRQYSFCMWLRRDGVAAAAGVLTIDLIDGSNNVIQDANSVNNSFTIDLTALTTSFVAYTGVFRTPTVLPATQKIRIRLTTALTSGRTVYLDKASLGLMSRCYLGGPYVAVHAGAVNFVTTDYGYVATTNDRGNQTNLASFGPFFQRAFGMTGLDLLLPSSATPTISDTALIV